MNDANLRSWSLFLMAISLLITNLTLLSLEVRLNDELPAVHAWEEYAHNHCKP
jgi:hypothetical protein